MKHKSDAFVLIKTFAKRIQNQLCDHNGEFENENFENFCNQKVINHNFSFPRTPQQNGVVEHKNRMI